MTRAAMTILLAACALPGLSKGQATSATGGGEDGIVAAPADFALDRGLASPDVGEATNGFPSWEERVVHEWINRARVAPAVEMAACGAGCAEGTPACYPPVAPLAWSLKLARSARFHSDNMARMGFFSHDSACNLVSNLDALYPGSCDGSASCACTSGAATTWTGRIGRFGASANGENISWGDTDPDAAFYGWLFEATASSACTFTLENGHRYNILKQTAKVGNGAVGSIYTMDFGDGSGTSGLPKVPSGAHYPRQAASVQFWANWYSTAGGPSAARVNVEGVCTAMSLQRGTATNGAWSVAKTGLGTGCRRYYFSFKDAGGVETTYPTTGSYAVGSGGSCPDWDAARPPSCDGPPTPVVSAVSPSFGPELGGRTVTVSGTNFVAGAGVAFGGVPATGVNVLSATALTAVAPAHVTGVVDVVVTNAGGSPGSLASAFFYAPPAVASRWHPVAPCRVVDTRNANGPLGGPALPAGGTRSFGVPGTCAIPPSAKSLTVNYTVTQGTQAGELRAFPGDAVWSGASVVSFKAGATRANGGVLFLATNGAGTFQATNASAGPLHFILDVNGYFE